MAGNNLKFADVVGVNRNKGNKVTRSPVVSVPKSAPYNPVKYQPIPATNYAKQYYAAPAYQAPVYQAPVYQQSYAAPAAYSPPTMQPAPAPAPPPKPKISEADWLKGDGEYQSQTNEYNRAINEFTSRINKKKKNFDDDYKLGEQATTTNKAQSLAGLGEDFAARGMSYSGVFDQARTEGEDGFKRQLANILTVKNRNVQGADDDLADYKQENELSRGNAKRNALARFANSQNLL